MKQHPSAAVDQELLCLRGRCHIQLHDFKKAKADFNKFLKAEGTKGEARARAYFDLAMIAFLENDAAAGKSFYKQAIREEAESFVVESSSKSMCESFMAQSSSNRGGARECHQCGKVSNDLKQCSGCKAVAYCSRECQKAAWKTHKHSCEEAARLKLESLGQEHQKHAEAAAARTQQSQERPVDYGLEGEAVWKEACSLTTSEHFQEAAERFCFAIFLKNSLDARMGEQQPVTVVVKLNGQSPQAGNPFAAILHGFTIRDLNSRLEHWEKVCESQPGHSSLQQESRVIAICKVLAGRSLGQAGGQTMDQKLFAKQMKLIEDAAYYMKPERYLTMMYELAYTYRDNGAFGQSKRWYKNFLEKAPATHSLRSSAEHALRMVSGDSGAALNVVKDMLEGGGGRAAPPCAQQ
eukprot:TRINITY_DN67015_c0_g1_i1.p1 TRINITY_DN67015_c0_g1~~TRINITY_DN67015_c0_g1_i1.p1  ORF type:complete len:453 (-),score=104.59 TRINITY_DN67015_c0_g1_i1:179-1402(-)